MVRNSHGLHPFGSTSWFESDRFRRTRRPDRQSTMVKALQATASVVVIFAAAACSTPPTNGSPSGPQGLGIVDLPFM
jgi:hypothetical protein